MDVDPIFYEAVTRDEAFRQAVYDFMEHHAPVVHTHYMRGALHNLVFSYFGTSQNIEMQRLTLALHNTYSLEGLMDMALLDTIRMNLDLVNQDSIRTNVGMANEILYYGVGQQPGSSSATIPNLSGLASFAEPAHTSTSTLPTYHFYQLTGEEPAVGSSAFNRPGSSAADDAGTGHVTTTSSAPVVDSSNSVVKCHPDGLEHKITIEPKDKSWLFKCDECGHEVIWREEFTRHMRVGEARADFKLVNAVPEEGLVWYGVDAAGNEYMGGLVERQNPDERRPKRGIPPPCGPRFKARRRGNG
ncbi:uncharacterized protein Z519_08629 [Cladophialophora bantiana CBS 173.52]|uniref:Uncharacterized protein n=1 Tax=Cladophialophora bantiana (strain ATCC 10958 / CBS 173.52 / CDC B-1940 / NIH 8579) TaxID=1442370 RepID=A0A0D2ELG1_CLAB1|nr:uncharacterized protein Z519_08629 [Cladophialophora bantiana CBS 173.52]KIW90846.1 hypothetical protein Z519_08629 [Cladophialophora bantiana CBS 173.52]